MALAPSSKLHFRIRHHIVFNETRKAVSTGTSSPHTENMIAISFAAASPLRDMLRPLKDLANVRMEPRSVPEAAKGEVILLQRPINVSAGEFGARSSQILPRPQCKLPYSHMLRRVQPDQRLGPLHCARQEAGAAFEDPPGFFDLHRESRIYLRPWLLRPALFELDDIKGNNGDIWPHQGQSCGEMTFANTVCACHDDPVQPVPTGFGPVDQTDRIPV